MLEEALGPNHPDVARSLNNLATLYRLQGQPDRAGAGAHSGSPAAETPAAETPAAEVAPTESFQRMSRHGRLQHAILISSFTLLVLTGVGVGRLARPSLPRVTPPAASTPGADNDRRARAAPTAINSPLATRGASSRDNVG